MNPRIYLFVFGLIILVIVCFFTARVFFYGLKLGNHTTRNTFAIAFLLPILYMASLVGTSSAKWANKTFYMTINVIAGIFFYLFLGAIALALISIATLLNGHDVPTVVAWAVLGIAVLVGIAGLIQARRIVVRTYTVSIPTLPDSWQNKTAAMISDTHFGLINHKKFSDKVVNKILSVKPDVVFHAGDFYDGPRVDTASLTASWKKLTEQVPLFYTPGNHEAYGDYTTFVESVRAAGATVLDDKMAEVEGVQIAGTLYHNNRESTEVAEALARMSLNKDKPTILINHPPTSLSEAAEAGVSLMLSGHTHRGQFWPLRYVTRKVYHGYDYGMKKFDDMTIITSDGIGTFGPPMRLFNSPEVVLITFKK